MLTSVCNKPDFFSCLNSDLNLVAKSLWECFPKEMIIVRVTERNHYIIEEIKHLQSAEFSNHLISVGKPFRNLLPSPLAEELIVNCTRCVKGEVPVHFEVADGCFNKGGDQHSFKLLLFPVMHQPGVVSHLLCIVLSSNMTNITQVAKYSEQEVERRVIERTAELVATNLHLTYLATHDGLTETYNRRHLLDLANTEFKRAARYGLSLCVMMLDIDHFKTINDEQGHAAGDHMLKTLAHAMRSTVRDWDLLGRYGGDEFIIILPETDIQGAQVIAERLSNTLQSARLSVSIGIATLELNDRCIDNLINRADHLLLNAKRNGRNRIECTSFALTA
ncbi:MULTISPECIES: GGDEF domain-containing protein [unclassified Halomonas]|uniref:GGDEF domain-containing protein n=1 Tax=unclassified Halomonas TaxID=2609666 RepID=UPI0005FCD0B9|nr:MULTISPECIES: GGDEF domain-containing protein [unclassified Halomonas]CEP36828.1 Diguanylate cyclase [Halomonas sp. R57-5]